MINKLGVCITMYNEHEIVLETLTKIKDCYDSYCIVVQSNDDKKLTYIEDKADKTFILPNLAKELPEHKIPSYSLTRNYGKAFTELYNTGIDFDAIVALCGDTLVTDPLNFDRRYTDMKNNNKLACVTQAIGQNFHAPDSNPANGICGGRLQIEGISDIMPQLFILDGKVAKKKQAFINIKIVNEFTSEHCLGDELVKMIGNFKEKAIVLSSGPYNYTDGVQYQAGE